MEYRHLNNAVQLVENQNQYQSSRTPEQPYMHRGRAIACGNGSFVFPTENVPRSTRYSATPRYMARGPLEHSSLSLRLGDSQVRAPHSCPSYESFLNVQGVGSFYAAQVNDTSHGHSIHNDRSAVREVRDGILDCGMNIRRPFKRKSSVFLSCERGSTSSYYRTGSSSNSFDIHPDKQALDYPNYPSDTIGLRQYGGNLSIGSEDHPRNVRSRPRIDLQYNSKTVYPSCYSSHHYRPTAHQSSDSDRGNLTFFSAGAANYHQNNVGVSHPAQGSFIMSGNTGLRRETDQYFVRGSTAQIRQSNESVCRDPVSSGRYSHNLLYQGPMEFHGNYIQRAVPLYRVDLRSSRWLQETAPTENSLLYLSETYSSRDSRLFSARSWHNHRDMRSRIAVERFQSFQNDVNAHDRMGSEALAVLSFVDGSRDYFDQYRDMRLDVDNMSYEELLALGERMGHVDTGLSEFVISKCLKETIYSSDKDQPEATCAICLEEYKNDDRIGTVSCGHDYHVPCIKRWLAMKNACPICKATALADISKEE